MKWLFLLVLLMGIGLAWFSTYEPTPSSSSMGGAITMFQEAIMAKDVNGMRALCSGRATESCQGLLDEIESYEERRGYLLSSISTIGFDYTRGRKTVDGQINGYDSDGDMVFSRTLRVENNEDAGRWEVTNF